MTECEEVAHAIIDAKPTLQIPDLETALGVAFMEMPGESVQVLSNVAHAMLKIRRETSQ